MIAMGQTMATYGGQNYGSGDVGRIKDGVKNALIAEFIYSLAAAAIMFFLYKPCLGLFFTGDVDLSAMIPWARTYCQLCILFFVPLSTIFIFRYSYFLACFADPAAWLSAGVFTGVSYLFVIRKIEQTFADRPVE